MSERIVGVLWSVSVPPEMSPGTACHRTGGSPWSTPWPNDCVVLPRGRIDAGLRRRFSRGDLRVVQFTPPVSGCSTHFGTNTTHVARERPTGARSDPRNSHEPPSLGDARVPEVAG